MFKPEQTCCPWNVVLCEILYFLNRSRPAWSARPRFKLHFPQLCPKRRQAVSVDVSLCQKNAKRHHPAGKGVMPASSGCFLSGFRSHVSHIFPANLRIGSFRQFFFFFFASLKKQTLGCHCHAGICVQFLFQEFSQEVKPFLHMKSSLPYSWETQSCKTAERGVLLATARWGSSPFLPGQPRSLAWDYPRPREWHLKTTLHIGAKPAVQIWLI